MATVSPPKSSWNRSETQKRIRHPLQSLRGYIRWYVILEVAAVALLFVALCFWAALIFDFGLFELTSIDVVKSLDELFPAPAPFFLRGSFLFVFLLCLVALITFLVLRRLFKEFADDSLALVLEKRFPNQLGDRLITAVEMANPKLSEDYGYSQAMVDQTIRSAAERVEKIPISQVFNWRRLWGRWLLALACSVGVWVALMAGFAGLAQATGSDFSGYFGSFTRTNSILTKRNLFLMDRVYWPTRSYIEIVRFQDSPAHPNQMKVGRDEQRPDVEARAFEYVIYDSNMPESIRPLRYNDLKDWINEPDLQDIKLPADWDGWIMDVDDLSASVPSSIIPKEWDKARAGQIRADLKNDPSIQAVLKDAGATQAVEEWLDWHNWTIDQLKLQMDRPEVRQPMFKNAKTRGAEQNFHKLLGRVEELTAASWSNWNIRKLKIPDNVSVYYRGEQTKSVSSHPRQEENRFFIGLNELKESVTFWVRGENFYTKSKEIELVPPPTFNQLLITKYEPAYIHYWLQNDQAPLKGKKQIFFEQPESLTGAVSRIRVPMGTDLELIASANRKLKDGIRLAPAVQQKLKDAKVPAVPVRLDKDKKTLRVHINNVRQPYEFEIRFNDEDNVKGKRHFTIQPVVDMRPQESVAFELGGPLRKPRLRGMATTSDPSGMMDSFLITPDALIPFKGTMTDDIGLTRMDWIYEYEIVDFELFSEEDIQGDTTEKKRFLSGSVRRASAVASGFQNLPTPGTPQFIGPIYWMLMGRYVEADMKSSASQIITEAVPMEIFNRRLKQLARRAVPLERFKNDHKKGKAPLQILPKGHAIGNNEDGFDVGKNLAAKIKVQDAAKEAQLHYRLRIYMAATDNNIEAKTPGFTKSKLPVTFLVISEKELLSQILIEEEALRSQLEKGLAKLRDAKTTLDGELKKLQGEPTIDVMNVMDDRVKDDILDPVQEKLSVAQEVFSSFRRIVDEMVINRVDYRETPRGYVPREDQNRIKEIKERILTPLAAITRANTGNFAVTETSVADLLKGINGDLSSVKNVKDQNAVQQLLAKNRMTHIQRAEEAQKHMTKLIDEMERVLDAIGGEISWTKLVAEATRLEQDQRRNVVAPLRRAHQKVVEEIFGDLAG